MNFSAFSGAHSFRIKFRDQYNFICRAQPSRQVLITKSELYDNCKVIECDESYTSKTCGYCGVVNDKLGGNKLFKCKASNCQNKFLSSDRDIHAARNILLRYLTRNNIVCPQNK